MKTLRIGLLAPLTGGSATMGIGFIKSAEFALAQKRSELAAAGLELEVRVVDYKSDPIVARKEAADCVRQHEVIALIGPCDSDSAYEIIESGVGEGCALMTPLATATDIARLGAANFFRLTTSDRIRSEVLVERICRDHPDQIPVVWSIAGNPNSYSQALRADVLSQFECRGIKPHDLQIDIGGLPSKSPKHVQPVVSCCVSSQTLRIVSAMREGGLSSPIYSFGSNTNLLSRSLLGAIVVADLDRHDPDPYVLQLVEQFQRLHGSRSDPSIATMNCIGILCNLLIRRSSSLLSASTTDAKEIVISDLRSETQRGFFRPFKFDGDGEMIGHEHISLLQIRAQQEGIAFGPVTDSSTDDGGHVAPLLSKSASLGDTTSDNHHSLFRRVMDLSGQTLAMFIAILIVTLVAIGLDSGIRWLLASGWIEAGSLLHIILVIMKYITEVLDFLLILILLLKYFVREARRM